MDSKLKNKTACFTIQFDDAKSILLLLILMSFLFNSCINLREEYPEITYYNLTPANPEISRIKVDGILQIRPFGGSNVISSKRFLVEHSSGGFEKYYYHRWSDDFQELFTWNVISYISNQKCFTGGIVNQGTALIPNYILEGDILKLKIFNHDKDKKDSSYVELSLKISLFGFNKDSTGLSVIYTNVIEKKVTRESAKANTIAPAVNQATNAIISQLSEEVIKSINK